MENKVFKSGFVALVGEANAGKSTLLNTLLGTKLSIVSPKSHTTRQRIQGIKTSDAAQIIFVDTPGFIESQKNRALNRVMRDSIYQALEGVDVAVLVVDAARASRSADIAEELRAELDKFEVKAPNVILLNKIDLIQRDLLLPLIASLSSSFASSDGKAIEIIPVSAKTGDGLDILERVIIGMLPEGPKYYPDEIKTDMPFEFSIGEFIREKLYFFLQKELPYSTGVRVEEFYEERGILHVFASIVVERSSQKGIVIGAKGEGLKRIGTSARIELEKLTNKKVNLQLHVRVEPQWTRTEQGLKRAGHIANG